MDTESDDTQELGDQIRNLIADLEEDQQRHRFKQSSDKYTSLRELGMGYEYKQVSGLSYLRLDVGVLL